jgi:hypothetical protein
MIGVAVLAAVAGVLIGCIGVGGVLLVPGLSLLGIDVHAAIAASLFSFIFSGVVGVFLFARRGVIPLREALWFGAGAAPGALAGALLVARLGGELLLGLVGAAVLLAGVRTIASPLPRGGGGSLPGRPLLLPLGAAIGAASALTGTGGPLLAVPLLLALRVPALPAVGLAQAIQVPIALTASAGALWTATLDLRLGAVLAVAVAAGTALGARLAAALPLALLTRIVAVVLLLVGALLALRSLAAALSP